EARGDTVERGIPGRRAAVDLRLQQAVVGRQRVAERGTLRAQAAAVGRMVGIAGDRAVGADRDAAADAAIGTGGADHRGAGQAARSRGGAAASTGGIAAASVTLSSALATKACPNRSWSRNGAMSTLSRISSTYQAPSALSP